MGLQRKVSMNDQQFAELLAVGHERPSTESKGPGVRTHKHFFAMVIRRVLGMPNHRDGGLVIIGVEEGEKALKPIRLSATN